jgi:general secretion pathway protein F
MQYHVRSLRLGDAAVNEQLLEAADEASLRTSLQTQGQTVLSVRAASRPWSLKLPLAGNPFPMFCREIRTLIHAGMTVVEAVDTLSARQRLEGRNDGIAAALLVRLEQGQSLSTSLSELPGTPAVLIAAVRAGERTSNLVEALDDYLRFNKLVEELRSKVISASIYPALVTTLGLGISLFLLLVVMPNFAGMYENLRGASKGTTALTIELSRFIGQHRALVLGGLLATALVLAYGVVSGQAKRLVVHAARAIPFIQRRIEDFQLAMMYQALALLLKGGYPMTDAMAVASQSALSPELKTALAQALGQIERGGLVSQALAQASLCDEVGRRLMAAAERNGDFHLAADVVSRIHGERFELFVERTTRIVEPLLLLAVALMVGTIVVMMYLPVFDMATSLR